jgi:hypothetical protein
MNKFGQVWISSSGQTFGPYSISQTEEYLNLGNFSRNDFYCDVGGNEWISLGKLCPMRSIENPPIPEAVKPQTAPSRKVVIDKSQDAGIESIDNYNLAYRKSWTAYIAPTIFSIIFITPTIMLISSKWILSLILIPIICFLSIRKYKLYTDQNGVWISYGLLPWTKGFRGVKWRDLNECTLVNSFLSWFLRSYTVVATHRYTKTDEVVMTHTRLGKRAVLEINGLHQKHLGMNTGAQMLQEG